MLKQLITLSCLLISCHALKKEFKDTVSGRQFPELWFNQSVRPYTFTRISDEVTLDQGALISAQISVSFEVRKYSVDSVFTLELYR